MESYLEITFGEQPVFSTNLFCPKICCLLRVQCLVDRDQVSARFNGRFQPRTAARRDNLVSGG